MEAGGVGICTRVENKQLIENTTRSKRTRLRIWRIGVRAVYVGMDAYISKLINSKELFELVEGVARDRTAQIPQPIKT
jgi:hypothetical protein